MNTFIGYDQWALQTHHYTPYSSTAVTDTAIGMYPVDSSFLQHICTHSLVSCSKENGSSKQGMTSISSLRPQQGLLPTTDVAYVHDTSCTCYRCSELGTFSQDIPSMSFHTRSEMYYQ